jgi:hypothetical protein
MYCLENDKPHAWAYLWKNWYSATKWNQWARSSTMTIPNAKSTMLVESHWRVLKRNFLYHYNRPRFDLLTYLMIDYHFASTKITYQQNVVMRREVLAWEREFVHEWNRCYNQVEVPTFSNIIPTSKIGCVTVPHFIKVDSFFANT